MTDAKMPHLRACDWSPHIFLEAVQSADAALCAFVVAFFPEAAMI
jgi:hypothetical protein